VDRQSLHRFQDALGRRYRNQKITLARLASVPIEQTIVFHAGPAQTPLLRNGGRRGHVDSRNGRRLQTQENTAILTLRRAAEGPLQYTVWSGQPLGFNGQPASRTPASFPSAVVHQLAVSILSQGG
jgi:hypothetical protein